MLKEYTIDKYIKEYNPIWFYDLPEGCPPNHIMVCQSHPFFRLAIKSDSYSEEDFKSYAEKDKKQDWGSLLPLALGLSIINNEIKARKSLKLPMFRKFKGIISITLNPKDGVVKQTGVHKSHYTWWRTKSFDITNLKMLEL